MSKMCLQTTQRPRRSGPSYLSKAAFADDLQDFVAVGDVVVWDLDVRPLIVVITAVIGPAENS